MKISKAGIDFIIGFEGFSAKARKCVSTEKYYTIGYGHYGADVKKDDTITKEEARKLLESDLLSFEKKVSKYDSKYDFNQNEFDALVSFAYNVGNIDQLTAKGTRSREKIAECMLRYNKSGGKVLNGLVKRREAESKLFLSKLFLSSVSTSNYYPKYVGNSNNIDMVLKAIGVSDKYIGSWTCRKPIANNNGISNYTGSMEHNLKLISLAKSGKLKRV